jgi:predicted TIM-barrel fold metal-dependent hydrolase
LSELLISSDSHVVESPDLWAERLPAAIRGRAPTYEHIRRMKRHPGETDPAARLGEMEIDGVSCEVLYPTLGLEQFGIPEPEVQEACFRVFNDWLIEYCSYAPARLLGLGCIATFDIDRAVRELERCKKAGLRGALIWQVPPANLPFAGTHYEKFWAAAQDLEMPVSLHILTGAPYTPGLILKGRDETPLEHIQLSVNTKLWYAANAMLDIVGSGVLDRYPKLKLVLVENEVSWIPFVISQWDKYIARGGKYAIPAKELPGTYFGRQVFATFFNDPPSKWMLRDWADMCMWSNDFPHPNSTWPHSREVIERDLGHLDAETRRKLVSGNVARLYDIQTDTLPIVKTPVAVPA